MRRRRKREVAGFNLAFLDVMACGLGGVVLILTLVKTSVYSSSAEESRLQLELEASQQQEISLKQEVDQVAAANKLVSEQVEAKALALAQAKSQLSQRSDEVIQKKRQKSSLIESIKKTKVAKTEDVILTTEKGEEDYLIGLRVEGRKVGILVDASSSMTDERLIDVIRRKNSGDKNKQAGPKWQRTKRIVQWLLARLPDSSDVSVVAFNGSAIRLGQDRWTDARNGENLNQILRDLNRLVPSGPTNLQQGLEEMKTLSPTNLYLVTDGLPTTGDSNYRSLNPFADCSSLMGLSSKISGACRVKLFQQTIKVSTLKPAVPVNVILLPIEGDPEAAHHFWTWTGATGGLMISPAGNWP
jgi:hypothetical protein